MSSCSITNTATGKVYPSQLAAVIDINTGGENSGKPIRKDGSDIGRRRKEAIDFVTPTKLEPLHVDDKGNLYRQISMYNKGYVLRKISSDYTRYVGKYILGESLQTRHATKAEIISIQNKIDAKYAAELKKAEKAMALRSKRRSKKVSPEVAQERAIRLSKALKIQSSSVEQSILQYLAAGNRINYDEIKREIFPRSSSEINLRIWMLSKSALSIDKLREGLSQGEIWEQSANDHGDPNFFRNALITVVMDYPTRTSMIDAILEMGDQNVDQQNKNQEYENRMAEALQEQEIAEQKSIDAEWENKFESVYDFDINELFLQDYEKQYSKTEIDKTKIPGDGGSNSIGNRGDETGGSKEVESSAEPEVGTESESSEVAAFEEVEVSTDTSQKKFLEDMQQNMSEEDPYERDNITNDEISYVFMPGSKDAVQATLDNKDTPITEHRLIIHPAKVAEVNDQIREELGFVEELVVGDILLVNGVLRKVKSIGVSTKQIFDKKQVDFDVRVISFEDGTEIKMILSSSEETIDDGFLFLNSNSQKTIKADFYSFQGNSKLLEKSIKYGYALSPDDMPGNLGQVLVDEDSFYAKDKAPERNAELLKVFSKTKDAVIFSNRITAEQRRPNKVEEAEHAETEKIISNLFNRIVNPQGMVEKNKLSPEYTANARTYAVDGLITILDNGAIGVTRQQILSTPGLPTSLATEKYFYLNGNLYINLDAIGDNSVYSELKSLFIQHILVNNKPLFERIAKLVKNTDEYDEFRSKDIEGEPSEDDENEFIIKVFQALLDNSHYLTNTAEFTGTMNEFINTIDSGLKNIDPQLHWKSAITDLAIKINSAVANETVKFSKMLNSPDLKAAKLATGKLDFTAQMNSILIDMMHKGNIIKTCK